MSEYCTHIGMLELTIDKVRTLSECLNFGFPTLAKDMIDTKTRLFLSGVAYVSRARKITRDMDEDAHILRLMDYDGDLYYLKQDVEALWLVSIAKGAGDVAAGYPEHFWCDGD
jgi:hypothetical protein